MSEKIIIRMDSNIRRQTRDAINKKLEQGLVLTEATEDGPWLELMFSEPEAS